MISQKRNYKYFSFITGDRIQRRQNQKGHVRGTGMTLMSTDSSISSAAMQNIVDRLKMSRVRDSTRKNYYSVWKSFNQFFIKLDTKPET